MSVRVRRKHRLYWDKPDMDVLEATSESFRIEVDMAFQKFISDGSMKEHSFPPSLNNFERKHIHQKAASFNLLSRSHGKDPNRTLTIYKKANKSNFESFLINLADQSLEELNKVLPYCQFEEPSLHMAKMSSSEKVFGKLCLGPPPEVSEAKVLGPVQAFREQLPIFEVKATVVDKIRNNNVLIISSETGSGKTTQIPQYIMDDARMRGEKCRILCTQPRRISAVSVAERVSYERGSSVGETVGYHIRLESKLGTNCNLIYCTNGVLIRSLMSGDGVLSSLTHVIIDEVHERDKLSDFLLICLRESLRKGANIKIILMSATINVEKFQQYFMGAEVLSIPGRLFTIKQLFLEDILELTGYDAIVMERRKAFESMMVFNENCVNPHFDDILTQCMNSAEPADSEQAWTQLLQYMLSEHMPVNYQHSQSGLTALMIAVVQGNVDLVEKLCTFGADPNIASKDDYSALSLSAEGDHEAIHLLLTMNRPNNIPREDLLAQYYKTVADEDINFDLLTRLICTIHSQCHAGAILVFLPGYDDIMLCNDRIMESDMDRNSYRVFFLHGSMNIKEQHDVFKKLPNLRKIILSTNIAETSLTIDDVVYVIDSGKAKIQTYDSCSGLCSLQTQWISKACVKQRAGRAGRTQSGICFHLFSQMRYESLLPDRVPEILRVPLEELCLNTKTVAGKMFSIYNFLVMAPDPPSPNTVKIAIENLEGLGALDKDENLTPLGEYLSQLTIEPHLGKMLIYSVIFRCLDPILTIVASLAQKDPFQLPPQANLRNCAAEKRKSLTANTLSDHMIYLKAFIKWQDSVRYRRERIFCREYFISPSTMETILKTRSQLLGQLRAAKFVSPTGNAMMELNTLSENWAVVKAVITSGLYPKMAFRKNGNFCTRTEKKVLIHNSSPLNKENLPVWLVYDDMVKVRNGHQVRGVTPVTPITVSLMCGIKTTSPFENYLEIDEWLEFEFPNSHIVHLRKCIDNIIKKKLLSPTNTLTDGEEKVLQALGAVLMYEDEAADLFIPVGIKQKPKFFEMNRSLCPANDNSRRPGGNGYERPAYQAPSTSGAAYSNSYGGRNRHARHEGDRSAYGNHYSGFQETGYAAANHYENGFRALRKEIGYYYLPPNGMNDQGVSRPPTLDPVTSNLTTQLSHMSTSDLANGGAVGAVAHSPVLNKSVFILIRVKQESSIRIAYDTNKWIFSPQTEKHIVSLDNAGITVYLLFTVHKMNTFYGIAQFVSLYKNRQRPQSDIIWNFKSALPYKKVSHLRNPMNNNRLIYDGCDGQVISNDVAIKLWELYQGDQDRPWH